MGSLVKLPHGHLMGWQKPTWGHAVVCSCCFTSQQTCNGYLRDRPCPASPQTDLGAMLLFFLLASHPSNMQRVPQGQTLSCFTPNRPGDHAVVLFSLLHIPATCKGYLRDRPCPASPLTDLGTMLFFSRCFTSQQHAKGTSGTDLVLLHP